MKKCILKIFILFLILSQPLLSGDNFNLSKNKKINEEIIENFEFSYVRYVGYNDFKKYVICDKQNNNTAQYQWTDSILYLPTYSITYKEFIFDSIRFYNSLEKFYFTDNSIIEYLITFKKDSIFCSWMIGWFWSFSIYSSFDVSDVEYLLSKKYSSLILIINFIKNNNDKIIVYQIPEGEADKIYEDTIDFYNKYKSLNIDEFRNKFKSELSKYLNYPILK